MDYTDGEVSADGADDRGSTRGSLYSALQRLEKTALIASDWGVTDNNRQARYYRITVAGRRAFGAELERWKRFAAVLDTVLRTT
jgi:PadR family transcriptional regulator PadR